MRALVLDAEWNPRSSYDLTDDEKQRQRAMDSSSIWQHPELRVEERERPEPADDEYPLTLTTAREADGYNTGVRSRGGEAGPLVARIHPETVEEHSGLVADDRLAVATRRGSVTVDIDRDEGVPRGMVWLPIHHPATNRLTLSERDPQSNEPHFKQCAARLVAPEAELPPAAAD